MIAKNTGRRPKNLWTDAGDGELIEGYVADNEHDEAAWVAEAYPVEDVEVLPDGRQRVRLAVAAEAWFERLLVGLGPQARVADAPPSLADAGRRASQRILDRYR